MTPYTGTSRPWSVMDLHIHTVAPSVHLHDYLAPRRSLYGHLADPDKWVDTPECTLLDASSTFGSVSSVSILPNVANHTSLHCKICSPARSKKPTTQHPLGDAHQPTGPPRCLPTLKATRLTKALECIVRTAVLRRRPAAHRHRPSLLPRQPTKDPHQ
jgi:hypothetical protein